MAASCRGPWCSWATILLQVAARVTERGGLTLYVTGEESPLQVKLRADRLGDGSGEVELLSETLLETILATATARQPRVMIVDSIQTVFTGDLEGAPGNVGRASERQAWSATIELNHMALDPPAPGSGFSMTLAFGGEP